MFKNAHAKPNQLRRRKAFFENCLRPKENPRSTCTDNCLFFQACEGLNWNRERSTPNRNKWQRRVKEGTSPVLVQSGLQESQWAEAMECYCYLRNVQDSQADGQTPYERQFNSPFDGPIMPFRGDVKFLSKSAKSLRSSKSVRHKKVLLQIFMRCALNASESCTGDLLIACMEDLKTMPPSEIHYKIIKK